MPEIAHILYVDGTIGMDGKRYERTYGVSCADCAFEHKDNCDTYPCGSWIYTEVKEEV